MTEDPEPAVNVSGGQAGGGVAAEFDPATADTRAEHVVDRLGELYWQKRYGGRDAFTCLVRTILSQNTSDKASQPAHDALIERYDTTDADLADTLAAAEQSTLAETISSAGLYNQKSRVLITTAEWVVSEFGSATAFDEFVTEKAPETVRETLLEVRGVGPKTADCVLLFAGGRTGVFPVDTHVHRIYRRLGIASPDADHEEVRTVLEEVVPAKKCGFGHTATIQFGREYCTARKPACLEDPDACPLGDRCDQVGVYPATEDVVDPAETLE
ncbi:endonuclease III domain-containing protein [Natronobacterium gregoryi]|uniref:EndoIII-related endonuclease n=2 Tax=Natronobacterium gregoryi TaxID=44930 RepID=L0AKK4_NATGS|nr:endonuclease III [Natronobacterium gregoryi]AFZ73692.1 putative endoIII-related endonuclease [Natronobacterium gregoryi SP2]ELY67653.1 HhH-GPD family protein [Natronobacterium gregoryi SP2]PLK19562.1 endonuclease III [Natronobacterium gregoryi SP2]SFJ01332.1 endonuclease-3 [Natronobacterium gregoryi]